MAIAKRPKSDQSATDDVVAERFISGAGKHHPPLLTKSLRAGGCRP